MSPRWRSWINTIVGGLLCLLMLLSQIPDFCFFHPDIQLKLQFYEHRAEFEKLIAMVQEDSQIDGVGDDLTSLDSSSSPPRPTGGVSQARWDEYRRLFRKTGASYGIERDDYPPALHFPLALVGFILSSEEKGIAYSPEPLSPVMESLDRFPPDSMYDRKGHVVVYKPIADHWYIYYDEW
jgi:hypothetical protein